MPRSKPRLGNLPANQPLAAASERLQLLEKAGLTKDRLAEILGKAVVVLETILEDEQADPFARVAAAKALTRDIIGVAPSRSSVPASGALQAPITIILPGYTRHELPRAPKVIGSSSTAKLVISKDSGIT